MIAGWVIALAGAALLLYGLAIFFAFSLAMRLFKRAAASQIAQQAQNSAVVQLGNDTVTRLIDKIPFAFLRNMVLQRLGGSPTAFALSQLLDLLREARAGGTRAALAGLAIVVASYWGWPVADSDSQRSIRP